VADEVEIQLQPVKSSHISAVGYDADSGTLVVEYGSGSRYAWYGVSQADYDGLMSADSAGKFMHGTIEAMYGRGSQIG
jgi:hypothetical protein